MPLRQRRSAVPDNSDPLFVAWSIMDGEREVRLIVGTDTLRELAFRDSNYVAAPMALWELYRDKLERAASKAYAADPAPELLLRLSHIG
jgi:hypothetical protein